ncbi:MAG: CvpA family protein [Balneolales bacterium]
MNLIDLIILAPLLLFAFRGYRNGLVRELLSAVGLVLAIFFAFQYMAELSTYLKVQLDTETAFVPYFSFGIIFLIVLLAVQIVIYLIEGILKIAFLSIPNRLLGSIFSTFKAGLVISIILLLFSGFNLPEEEVISDSLFYPYIIQLAPETYNTVANIYPGASNFVDAVQDIWENESSIELPGNQ